MSETCGKVIHFSPGDAEPHVTGLTDTYGEQPNVYVCDKCSKALGSKVYHVGYTKEQARKLSKRGRRRRKRGKLAKQRRLRASEDDTWK